MTHYYTRIDVDTAAQKLQSPANANVMTIIDIRHANAYHANHIQHAIHLTDQNLSDFLARTDRLVPLLVYCYHGHNSQQAAQFFAAQGFTEVYSLDGGFAAWQTHYPQLVDKVSYGS